MNSRRTILAFVSALLISGLFTWAIGRTLRNRTGTSAPPAFGHIVVASKDVPAGEVLVADSLSISDWAAPKPLAGSLSEAGNAIGRVALVALVSGEPILQRNLANAGSGQGISATIPRGMRAITIRGPDITGISGFLEPGDLVDVLATCQAEGPGGSASSVSLQAVRVFAVGDRTSPNRAHETTAATTTSLTLLVAPAEVAKLNLAMTSGRVLFAVRNAMDTSQESYQKEDVAPRKSSDRTLNPERTNRPVVRANNASSGEFTVETVAGGKLISQSFAGNRP